MVAIRLGRTVQYLVLIGIFGVLVITLFNIMFVRHSPPESSREARDVYHSDRTLMIDDSGAEDLKSRMRVLCWIPSVPKQLLGKVKAVNSTWVKRCDGHIYFVEGPGMAHVPRPLPRDVVSLDVPPGYYNLTTKVVTILLYLYRYHLEDYDWFLKGDDDAYIVMENLRFILSHYDPGDPVYLGHLYKQHHPSGYMSGGASYVLSREALRRVVLDGYKKEKCATRGKFEDVEVGRCLHQVGIESFNTRDRFGRDTFHPLRPSTHIVGPIPFDQIPQDRFSMVSGMECCSQLTVSFHKVDPALMRVIDQLLYRTSVYGRVLDLPALDGFVKPGAIPPLKN
ncbi:hypothetical protein ACOMHN_064351 [Nucella lapillus]